MSVGPEPDVNGNITAGSPCASCAGESVSGDPARDQDYGNPARSPQAAPEPAAPEQSGGSSLPNG